MGKQAMGKQAMGKQAMGKRRMRKQMARDRARIREEIAIRGVAVVEGSLSVGGRDWLTHYTVGLTRLEGHPEIIVVGECCECAERILRGAADAVRDGARLGPGWGLTIDGWVHVLIEVEQTEQLVAVQDLYRLPGRAPVPALQAMGTDELGELPWVSGIGSELMLGPAPFYAADR